MIVIEIPDSFDEQQAKVYHTEEITENNVKRKVHPKVQGNAAQENRLDHVGGKKVLDIKLERSGPVHNDPT